MRVEKSDILLEASVVQAYRIDVSYYCDVYEDDMTQSIDVRNLFQIPGSKLTVYAEVECRHGCGGNHILVLPVE